jgi:hypothetical protein
MMVILSAQLTAGIVAFSRDLVVPYSAARATARYIQSQHLENKFMVGSRDATSRLYAVISIARFIIRNVKGWAVLSYSIANARS